jgi:hypothetical protein
MPDTALGHVGQKGPLGHAAENDFLSDVSRIPLETFWETSLVAL